MNRNWHNKVYKRAPMDFDFSIKEWQQLRDSILKRDRYACLRCEKKYYSKKGLSIHHLIPRANGGTDDPSNLVTLCYDCHNYVEGNNLYTIPDIIGSVEDVRFSEISGQIDQIESDSGLNLYNQPSWHKWVYGGAKNPVI